MSRLLRFLVERTLDGRADEIKEYVLGVEVFDRGGGYDPRLDSIVRVEVRRLRSKLDEYYLADGAADPVRIRIPRGSYVPEFAPHDPVAAHAVPAASAPAVVTGPAPNRGHARRWARLAVALGCVATPFAGWWVLSPWFSAGISAPPRVAVLPFDYAPATADAAALAERVSDRLATALVRTGAVEVVSRRSAAQLVRGARSAPDIGAALQAAWLVEGTLEREAGDRVRVDARLVDPIRDRKVWADTFTVEAGQMDTLDLRLATAVAAAIAAARTQAGAVRGGSRSFSR